MASSKAFSKTTASPREPEPRARQVRRFLFLVTLLATGCAGLSGPDWAAIGQQATQIRAGCESQFTAGIIKTHLATEQCADPAIRALYASAGWRDLDVLDAYLARRKSIAERLDRKAISPEEARAQVAQATADQNTELQNRATNRLVGAAAMHETMPMFCTHAGPTLVCQ